jgi:predicted RNA-binding Zn-ribbon protein involved in translation (DUF1610 family)
MVDELEPCPFCGIPETDNGFIAHTDKCYLMLRYMGIRNKKELSVAWNNRPIEDGLQEHIDTLRKHEIELLSDLAHSTYACPHCQMKILQCGECERKVRMQG